MVRELDESFQRELDAFNVRQGGDQKVVIAWDAKQGIWTVWVVPHAATVHRDFDAETLNQLMREFPDYSGRWGVKIFDWADEVEDKWTGEKVKKFRSLDMRLFEALKMADSFNSRQHFEETFEDPDFQRQLRLNADIRDIAAGAASYWYGLDKVTVGAATRGNWRWRNR